MTQAHAVAKHAQMPSRFAMRGYRERLHFDRYDCLVYGSGLQRRGIESSYRLFGNANIGNLTFTNLHHPGMFPADETAIVTNWYARTNIPEGPLRDALGSMMHATLMIGSKPFWQGNFADLFKRSPGMNHNPDLGSEAAEREREDNIYHLAKIAHDARPEVVAHAGEDPAVPMDEKDLENELSGASLGGLLDQRVPFEALPIDEQAGWYNMAAAIHSHLNPRNVLVIPVRQSFGVNVDMYNKDHVNKALIAFDDPNWDKDGNRIHLLSAAPGHPADRPGIWVHLEGWVSRDIC